jgi:hypothetical protein
VKLNLKPEELKKIASLVKLEEDSLYHALGYAFNLETGELMDLLVENKIPEALEIQIVSIILSHFATAEIVPKSDKLIKYGDLPGGHAYERAYIQRAIDPITEAFGDSSPSELIEAAKLLNGVVLDFGDVAVEIPALHRIPLLYVLWLKGEFPASLTVLYDESASRYLPTEDLAILTELTSSRLIKAKTKLIRSK